MKLNLRVVLLKLIFVTCFVKVLTLDKNEGRIKTELDVIDLELADSCDELAEKRRLILTGEDAYNEEAMIEKAQGHLLKFQSETVRTFDESDVPDEVMRAWKTIKDAGDALMNEEDWNELVKFKVEMERLSNAGIQSTAENFKDFQQALHESRNVSFLKEVWSQQQKKFSPHEKKYINILQLVKKATGANDASTPRAYWEMLTEYEDGFSNAQNIWDEIEPLYKKLQEFVKVRLLNYYKIHENHTEIPVYLLGSNFGDDWSYIADIILPYPQHHYNVDGFLKSKDMLHIYKLVELTLQDLKLGKINWKTTFSKRSCDVEIVNFCSSTVTELFICNSPSWTSYLDAYETAIRAKFESQQYKTYIRNNLRYSPLKDALVNLGSIFAIDATMVNGSFAYYSEEEMTSEVIKMNNLLLAALRILPRLAYYFTADHWRIQELESISQDTTEQWWKYRKDLQGVAGVTSKEADYLGDKKITSNRPYLSEFFGLVLQFQILEYYKSSMMDFYGNVAQEMGNDYNFREMIRKINLHDWMYLLNYYYGIYEVSASSLLEYFRPLEEYMENAPLTQAAITTTTTSTTTTTTTTAKTTTTTEVTTDVSTSTTANIKPSQFHQNVTAKEVTQNPSSQNNSSNNSLIYIGGGILVVLFVILIVIVVIRQRRKRRRRQNNRRYET